VTSLRALDRRFRRAAEVLVQYARSLDPGTRVTSTRRSRVQQARLYRRYLRGLSPLPAAPPGQSLHERGLAVDLVMNDLPTLGAWWISQGGRWSASDPVHFEASPDVLA
jgi:D-alanyl-D-alanine carboxypeptidase-like protein